MLSLGSPRTALLLIDFVSKRLGGFHDVNRWVFNGQSRGQIHHRVPLTVAEMIKTKHADLGTLKRRTRGSEIILCVN